MSAAPVPRPGEAPRLALLSENFRQDPEFHVLLQEKDPRLFAQGLLHWALRRESRGDLDAAAKVYAELAAKGDAEIAAQALRRLDLLEGKGRGADRAEAMLARFTREALHPAGVLGMTAASLAFRVTRLASLRFLLGFPVAGPLTRGAGARLAASLAGFAAETSAMLFAGKGIQQLLGERPAWNAVALAREWRAGALFLAGIKLGADLGATVAKRTSVLSPTAAPWKGVVLTQSSLLGGAILGKGLEHGSLGEGEKFSWLEGMAAYLQAQAGAGLGRALLGSGWQALEASLEQRARLSEFRGPRPKGWLREAGALAAPGKEGRLAPASDFATSLMSGVSGTGGDPRVDAMLARFRPRFPPASPKVYSEEILETALETPLPREEWRERLLEAYAEAKAPGSYEQLLIAEGVKKIFDYNGLRSGIGSFDLSVLQFAFERALGEGRPTHRRQSLRLLFYLMSTDLSRPSLRRAFHALGLGDALRSPREPLYPFTFAQRLAGAVGRHWAGYDDADIPMLLNFVYAHSRDDSANADGMIRIFGRGLKNYPQAELRGALHYASRSSLGKLALRRIFLILAAEDIPAKLRELKPQDIPETTPNLLREWGSLGLDPEELAYELSGTSHNAYLEDIRLARKVVSVLRAKDRVRRTSEEDRRRAKLGLQSGILETLRSGGPLHAETLLRLLQWNPDRATQLLISDLKEGRLDIRVAGEEEFEALFRAWGQARRCDGALFVKAFGGMTHDLILVRELSPAARAAGESSHAAYEELMLRLEAVVHEWEHFRHFNGEIEMKGISREERLVSEIMASLEEDRWQSYFSPRETPLGRLARRLGQPLPLYLRDFHDWLYFSRRNAEQTAGWLRD
ncbi:MAG: hypothetical protein IT572_04620 [Deltaproteobacteria bacterium]|nr:hypothetical protein [Deltaproteobacteria bacterium]